MAKKQVKKLNMNFDKSFVITVPKVFEEIFKDDLAKNEISLSIDIVVKDETFTRSLYMDYIKNGELTITHLTDDEWSVLVCGQYIVNANASFEANLVEALKATNLLPIICTHVSDNDANCYYIDDNENIAIEIGTVSLV
jgi:hypothetical protein